MKAKSKHPLAGRKWTPEQIAKAKKTREYNRALKAGAFVPSATPAEFPLETRVKDALSFLREAQTAQTLGYMRTVVQLAIYTLKGEK